MQIGKGAYKKSYCDGDGLYGELSASQVTSVLG